MWLARNQLCSGKLSGYDILDEGQDAAMPPINEQGFEIRGIFHYFLCP